MTRSRLRGLPPGRAGRVWLRRRVLTAQRGRDQLDRKLRILMAERHRLRDLLDGERHEWSAAWGDARTWLLRAAVLGGEDCIRVASSHQPVMISVHRGTSMGVVYPVSANVVRGQAEPQRLWGNSALAPACEALWRTVEAGARLAVTEEALRCLEEEIRLTRRRLRALDQRWLPRLAGALHDLELTLEQEEHEDGIRVRRAGEAVR